MSWLAEILRKEHRTCSRCRVGPTHLYDPPPSSPGNGEPDPASPMAGTPLCNSCLEVQLRHDLAAFQGKAIIFEPALGPEAFVFLSLQHDELRLADPEEMASVTESLSAVGAACDDCGAAARFAWVPVEEDACLWPGDWIPLLASGSLAAAASLCGRCAAARLTRTFTDRGLYFEAIVPPREGDGVMVGSET